MTYRPVLFVLKIRRLEIECRYMLIVLATVVVQFNSVIVAVVTNLIPAVCGQLSSASRFELTSHVARSFVDHREQLDYRYRLQLDEGFNEAKVVMDTVNLIETNGLEGGLLLNWEDSNNLLTDAVSDNDVSLVVTETGWHLTVINHGPRGNLLEIIGNVSFTTTEDVPLGSKLQPRLDIDFVDSDNNNGYDLLLGDHVYIHLPSLEVSTPTPPEVDSKENTTMKQTITLTSGSMASSILNVYTPNNVTISHDTASLYMEEPFLTATAFRLLETTGLTTESQEILSHVTTQFVSNSKSSENDEVLFEIPPIQVASSGNGLLTFETEAEALDFIGQEPGVAMVLCTVLEVGESFFLVEGSAILSAEHHAEVERKPDIQIVSNQIEVYETADRSQMLLMVGLEHTTDSWASAYNISLFLYLPPFLMAEVTLAKTADVLKSSKHFIKTRGDHVVEFQMTRLSFAHKLRLQFNVTMDTDSSSYQESSTSSVLVEAVCDSWRDNTEMAFPGAIQLQLPSQKRPPKGSLTCRCSPDGTASCRCSHDNVCGYYGDGVTCVDCNRPWDCVRTLSEHGTMSALNGTNGSQYWCPAASRKRKPYKSQPCVELKEGKCIQELHISLGTLLGEDAGTGHLYGISRNGLAYMKSPDGGASWAAVTGDVYVNASLSEDFMGATFRSADV